VSRKAIVGGRPFADSADSHDGSGVLIPRANPGCTHPARRTRLRWSPFTQRAIPATRRAFEGHVWRDDGLCYDSAKLPWARSDRRFGEGTSCFLGRPFGPPRLSCALLGSHSAGAAAVGQKSRPVALAIPRPHVCARGPIRAVSRILVRGEAEWCSGCLQGPCRGRGTRWALAILSAAQKPRRPSLPPLRCATRR